MKIDPYDDQGRHLIGLPDHVLRDLARNDAAPRDYRRKAVEVLVSHKSPYAKHPDLQILVHELEIELENIQFEHPAPSGPGPLVASVTTETMSAEEVVGEQGSVPDKKREGKEPKSPRKGKTDAGNPPPETPPAA